MLLTVTDSPENVEKDFKCSGGWMEQPENVSDYSFYQVPPNLKISWKSVYAVFYP